MNIEELCKELGIVVKTTSSNILGVCYLDPQHKRFVIEINEKLSGEERESVLAHELAHIIRGDHLLSQTLIKRYSQYVINLAADAMIHAANPMLVPQLNVAAGNLFGQDAKVITYETLDIPKQVVELGIVPTCNAISEKMASMSSFLQDILIPEGVSFDDLQEAVEDVLARSETLDQDTKATFDKLAGDDVKQGDKSASRCDEKELRQLEKQQQVLRNIKRIVNIVQKITYASSRANTRKRSWAHPSRRVNVAARVYERRPLVVVAVDISGSMDEFAKYALGIAHALEKDLDVVRVVFASHAAIVKDFSQFEANIGYGTAPETIFDVVKKQTTAIILISDFIFCKPFVSKVPVVAVGFCEEKTMHANVIAPKVYFFKV